jgi:hypothetical protein
MPCLLLPAPHLELVMYHKLEPNLRKQPQHVGAIASVQCL